MKPKMQRIALVLGALSLAAIVLVLVILGRQAPDLPEVSDVPLDPQSIAYEELKSASSRSLLCISRMAFPAAC